MPFNFSLIPGFSALSKRLNSEKPELFVFLRSFFQKVRENSADSGKIRYLGVFSIEIKGDLAVFLKIPLIFAPPWKNP